MEKRQKAVLPPLAFSEACFKDLEAYFNDNFGFRDELINGSSQAKVKLFHSSLNPGKVMYGKKGWLFYNDSNDRIFQSYTHTNLLTEDKLIETESIYRARKEDFHRKNRRYALAFWPNPQSIYPELMPFNMRIQIKDTLAKVDQLINYFNKIHSSVRLTDVRQALWNGKKTQRLYRMHDTHWNAYGAFLAYQKFFKDNFEELGIVPKNIEDFDIAWNFIEDGDLLDMLGLKYKEGFQELIPVFTYKHKDNYQDLSTEDSIITKNVHCQNGKKLLVFRDSYTIALIQFYSLHFSHVIYIWSRYDQGVVEKIKPDIVIEQYVERHL